MKTPNPLADSLCRLVLAACDGNTRINRSYVIDVLRANRQQIGKRGRTGSPDAHYASVARRAIRRALKHDLLELTGRNLYRVTDQARGAIAHLERKAA